MKRRQRILNLWLGLVISAVFIFLLLRQIDPRQVASELRKANVAYLGLTMLFLVINYVLRALRWRYILRPVKTLPRRDVFRVFIIGFMANNLLPARLGELVRAYLLGQVGRVSATAALGTIAIERVFDVLMLLLYLIGGGASSGVLGSTGQGIWTTAALALILLAGIYAASRWGDQLVGLGGRTLGGVSPRLAERAVGLVRSFVTGLQAMQGIRDVGVVFGSSLVAWATIVMTLYWTLRAFSVPLSFPACAFVLGVGGLGVIIPSSPGNAGTLEFFYVSALALLAVDPSVAFSFAITLHALDWGLVTVMGLIFLWGSGLSLGRLWGLTAEETEAAP
ncbi:MAG: flippase-like domain-containing protein [Anaerolineae bacterium]|nr:flippase-like domain-containing protein [Anaerolineae bacterium]